MNSIQINEIIDDIYKFTPEMNKLQTYVDDIVHIKMFKFIDDEKRLWKNSNKLATRMIFVVQDKINKTVDEYAVITSAVKIVNLLKHLVEVRNDVFKQIDNENYGYVDNAGMIVPVSFLLKANKIGNKYTSFWFENVPLNNN